MRSLLDHQADGIEYTLHSHGIAAEVVGGNISPRLIQFHIRLEAGTKYSRVAALAEDLALALNVPHCRITREGYTVKIEVPRPDPVAVRLFPLMRNLTGELPENAPVLGLDECGVPLLVRLGSPDISHMLIAGGTGSGKTVLTRSMIASLALQNPPEHLRLLLIDTKGKAYSQFEGLPNLICPIVNDSLDALHRLRWVVRHIEKREEQGINSPALAVFVDEMAELATVNSRELEQTITRIVQSGHEVGIHIIACAKQLSPALLNVARNSWPTRIVGRTANQEEAKAASGIANSGAEKLMGQGDFLLFAKEEAVRLQAAHISPAEMEQTVTHLGGQPGQNSAETSRSRATTNRSASTRARQYYASPAYEAEEDEPAEKELYEKPKPRRASQSARNFRQTPATLHQEQDSDHEGISERLARYHESIRDRRDSRSEARNEVENDEEYHNPLRARQEQTRRKPVAGEEQEEARPSPTRPKNRTENEQRQGTRNVMSSTKSNLLHINKISS